jgi:DNA-binding LacI/PurR family transcriptional regulator/signal transduction histidine kinase
MQRESSESPRSGLLTLGLLVDWLEDNYQNAVVSGVADAARELGVNLICFAGGVLRSPHRFAAQRNVVYDLAGAENVDGLMIMSGTLGNHIGPEELSRYCERYAAVPMCSIAVPLPGIPSVLVDNATGMRDLIVHLLEVHGYRRIAFIRGPEANDEAERRYRVYRDVLAEHDLRLEPQLIVVGDFQRESGARAIGVLLDERGAEIDVVVAASDSMALGAIDALRARGLAVPEDVAVAGFDDVEEARFCAPALTTVRQPLYEQGRRAVELLLATIRGEAVPEQVTLHTEIVTRQSCRCSWRWARRDTYEPTPPSVSYEPSLIMRRPRAIAEMTRAARAPDLDAAWAGRVFDAFAADLHGAPGGASIASLGELLRKVLDMGGDAGAWQDVVSALRGQVLPGLASEPELCARAEHLWHDLRLLVANVAESAQAQHRLDVERWARSLSGTSQALITTFDVLSLVRAAAEQLPRLRIKSCYLSLYERGPPPLEASRLILGYDDGGATRIEPPEPVFPSRQLAPSDVLPLRRVTFVLEPLFFKEDQLGFVLFELGPREGTVYEALREQISAALKGALLVQEVVEKDRERERLLADLEKRAHQLEHAYQAIQENQEKLLISEKLASLGRLTASIVHEMNTPLAAVRAALVDLGKLVNEYHESAGDAEVTVEDHGEIAKEMRQTIGLASSAAERAALFVRGIKAQTRDLGPHERQAFNVVSTIRQALLLLGHAMRKGNCRAVFEPPAEYIELHGSPVRFSQVVTNLVENAVDATVPKGGGAIDVKLAAREDALVLDVADSGTGIDAATLRRIFEPMFTTKPFGQGTGLGLSIVHDIVTGDFGGAVDVESRPDQGTTFTVRFPKGRET